MKTNKDFATVFFALTVMYLLLGAAVGMNAIAVIVGSLFCAFILTAIFAWMANVLQLLTEIRDRLPQAPQAPTKQE